MSAQKDEIVLEFTQPDVLRKKEEHLLEMRFFVPDTEPVVEDEVRRPHPFAPSISKNTPVRVIHVEKTHPVVSAACTTQE